MNCGYAYTLGNSKASIVLMDKLSSLPPNHLSYTLKIINKFFSLIQTVKDNEFKQYILTLAYQDTLLNASKYLTTKDQKTYLMNVLKTKLKNSLK
jgi:hypothetical protein